MDIEYELRIKNPGSRSIISGSSAAIRSEITDNSKKTEENILIMMWRERTFLDMPLQSGAKGAPMPSYEFQLGKVSGSTAGTWSVLALSAMITIDK